MNKNGLSECCIVAMLVHTIGVAALTQLYERFTEVLTCTEGLSRLAARNALIVKRVCFEFIDGLLPLVRIQSEGTTAIAPPCHYISERSLLPSRRLECTRLRYINEPYDRCRRLLRGRGVEYRELTSCAQSF